MGNEIANTENSDYSDNTEDPSLDEQDLPSRKDENRGIALKLRKILCTAIEMPELLNMAIHATFTDKEDLKIPGFAQTVELVYLPAREPARDFVFGHSEIIKRLPRTLKYPAFFISPYQTGQQEVEAKNEGEPATSRFGILPEQFIGADNRLYWAHSNSYFVNERGQDFKTERIRCANPDYGPDNSEGLEEAVEGWGYQMDLLKKVDFTPKKGENIKQVRIEQGDYEKIKAAVFLIESGKFWTRWLEPKDILEFYKSFQTNRAQA